MLSGFPALLFVVVVVLPAGVVVCQVPLLALKSDVQVLPFSVLCSVNVARLPLTYVADRDVVSVDVSPDGDVVVIERSGDSIPKPGRGSGVSVVETVAFPGTLTVVDVGPRVDEA